jgi:ZIP family zinc transporter
VSAALGWGALAASSLLVGVVLALTRRWPTTQIGLVLAFGAGALISAVSLELAEEGVRVGGFEWVAAGLAAGALTYFTMNRVIAARFGAGGTGLALGAFLDGIPEQLVLGIGIAAGGSVSIALLVAIFVSNLPEAIGSATEMQASGRDRATVVKLWIGVALICVVASLIGFAVAEAAAGEPTAAINGFAAGALLVMLIDSMIPDAKKDSGNVAGLAATLGFAVATALSSVS